MRNLYTALVVYINVKDIAKTQGEFSIKASRFNDEIEALDYSTALLVVERYIYKFHHFDNVRSIRTRGKCISKY